MYGEPVENMARRTKRKNAARKTARHRRNVEHRASLHAQKAAKDKHENRNEIQLAIDAISHGE